MKNFNYDDDVFVLDSGFKGNDIIHVLPRKFESFTNQKKTTAVINGKSKVNMNTWAIFKSQHEAIQGAIVFLIQTKELGKLINENIDINKLYNEFELNCPELILKYMEKVILE